jgi:hypothetical protein
MNAIPFDMPAELMARDGGFAPATGSLRDCLGNYSALGGDDRARALIVLDSPIALPGSAGLFWKLECDDIERLLGLATDARSSPLP